MNQLVIDKTSIQAVELYLGKNHPVLTELHSKLEQFAKAYREATKMALKTDYIVIRADSPKSKRILKIIAE